MPTVAEIIEKVQRTFPNASDEECLEAVQEVHSEITFKLKLKPATQTLSSLVVGTATYAMTSGTSRVYEVRYRSSAAANSIKLRPTSIDELGMARPNWRDEQGTPDSYVAEFGNITLIPKPSVASSGGYPRVEIDLTTTETLTTGVNLPSGLPSYQAWIDGAKAKIAEDYEDARIGFYASKARRALDSLYLQVQQQSAECRPRIIPPGGFNSFRVRK